MMKSPLLQRGGFFVYYVQSLILVDIATLRVV